MNTEVERAVGNKVWHDEHPWIGRGVDKGSGNLWRDDRDERHFQEWATVGVLRVKSRRRTVSGRVSPKKQWGLYTLPEVRAVENPCNIRQGCGKGARRISSEQSKLEL